MLAKIAKKFDNYECMECAQEMVKAAEKHGVSGKLVTAEAKEKTRDGFVYSDKQKKVISTNNNHVGAEFDGKVYDNHTPEGLDRQKWEDDLHHANGIKTEDVAFGPETGYEKAKSFLAAGLGAIGAVLSDEAGAAVKDPVKAIVDWSPLGDVRDATKIEGLGGCANGWCSDEMHYDKNGHVQLQPPTEP